ncbi:MAG: methyltransferase family protein [Candidatus Thorarchaeota archaeon]
MLEYSLIILSVAVFGLLHSGISAHRVKNRIIDKWGKGAYANIFNITSSVTIFVAFLSMWYWDWLYFLFTPELVQPVLFVSGLVLMAVALIVTNRASKVISVSTVADMRTDRETELVTDGIYARVRHPLYLATLLLLFGLMAIYPFAQVVVFSLALCIYTVIGAFLEERKLVTHYGQDYIEYKKQAGFLLPRIR